MEQGVVGLHGFGSGGRGKGCGAGGDVDGGKVVLELGMDPARNAQLVERVGVLLDAEHAGHAGVEGYRDVIAPLCRAEAVPCHVHDLLRGYYTESSLLLSKYKTTPNSPPAHLMTPAGWVKTAFPPLSASISFQVLSHVS